MSGGLASPLSQPKSVHSLQVGAQRCEKLTWIPQPPGRHLAAWPHGRIVVEP